MTNLDQLARELVKVQGREKDSLLELAVDQETKNPQEVLDEEWSRLSVRKEPTPPENDLFGIVLLISDEELLRSNAGKADLIEVSYYRMFRELAATMAVAGYAVHPMRVLIDMSYKPEYPATELRVTVRGEYPLQEGLNVEALTSINLNCLWLALDRSKNERR